MYPEKAKREEKPKRGSKQGKHPYGRLLLALLFFVPTVMFVLPRLNLEQFVDMALLTLMISLAVYLVYQSVIVLLATVFGIEQNPEEHSDLE